MVFYFLKHCMHYQDENKMKYKKKIREGSVMFAFTHAMQINFFSLKSSEEKEQ